MNLKKFMRVAIAGTLVTAISASLWYAAPTPVQAFQVSAPVAISSISGNTTYLLGEKIRVPAYITFDAHEFKNLQSISLNITGPESFVKELPFQTGSYHYTPDDGISGNLTVNIGWQSGIGASAYGYGYGYSGHTGTGNITYDIRWTPPYNLTIPPALPPANLPGVTSRFDISIPNEVYDTTSAYTAYPQGLAFYGSDLYTILPAYSYNGTASVDIILKTDTQGTYKSYINAPSASWTTEALTFIGGTLYAAYNEYDYTSWSTKGRVAKYVSGNWTAITGLSNLKPIGGLASDGTNLFIAHRDELKISKRNPTTGAEIASFDLSGAWGAMGWPPIWGFDALAYGSDLYAAQGETIIKVDPTTGSKTGEYKTGKWGIRGLEFVDEVYSNGTFKILYLATTEWPGKVYRAAKPGDTPQLEKSPIGNYNTLFKVIANSSIYTSSSNFTLGKLSAEPTVTITAPTQNFAFGATSENITVTGSINDPSISSVSVGIALPEVTAFQDNTENQTDTLGKWQHSAISPGMSPWMPYDGSADLWHRSNAKDHTSGTGYSWRYANPDTGNFATGWMANAGALRSKNKLTIGDNNKLTFWTWYDTDWDFWPDRKWVEVSTDGTNWQLVAWLAKFWPPFMPPDIPADQFGKLVMVPEKAWTKVEIPLAAYAGQDVYLRFRMDTMDDWNNSGEGWYIDDIAITGAGFLGKTATVADDLTFTTQFTLVEGSNTITARASRANYEPKLTGSASVSGSLDKTNPIVALNALPSVTKDRWQIISGNVTEANFDRLELKKNTVLQWQATLLGTGNTFAKSIDLDEGLNTIFVNVTDKVGLAGNTTAQIRLDTVGPVFEAVFPGSANKTYDVGYVTGEISARANDWFVIALKITDNASGVKEVKLQSPDPSESQAQWPNAMSKTKLPEAVIDSWGIKAATKSAMNYVMPMWVPTGAPAGDYSFNVWAWDNAGNSANVTVQVKVVTTLEAFNIYLMPDWNLVSTPLIPETTNITTVTTDIAATGLFERVWYYDASESNPALKWKLYLPGTGGDLTTLEAGKGYWFKMKDLAAFRTAGKVSGPMMSGLPDTPAPVKLTICGQVLQAGAVTPPTYPVYAGWNLVGLHSEYSSPVSTALQSVTVPQQKWGSILQYLNYIYFPMQEKATPQIDLGRFDRLISTESMVPGRGFWLYMVEAGILVP